MGMAHPTNSINPKLAEHFVRLSMAPVEAASRLMGHSYYSAHFERLCIRR
jgi:hypothetical protein